ncbi:hypothetical protein CTI12_AA200320 [Artemisia annua]|uniref:Uncharacterized protein n=1 Tax=Artemisia annua TaxID=35608 RepID=A0A2U1P2S3_ARTAN|nr:hypothetical protein CTI12_AA200320 [Artemisia annua]
MVRLERKKEEVGCVEEKQRMDAVIPKFIGLIMVTMTLHKEKPKVEVGESSRAAEDRDPQGLQDGAVRDGTQEQGMDRNGWTNGCGGEDMLITEPQVQRALCERATPTVQVYVCKTEGFPGGDCQGKATVITIGGLVAGMVVGSAVENWLQVDIVPFLGIRSPATVDALELRIIIKRHLQYIHKVMNAKFFDDVKGVWV